MSDYSIKPERAKIYSHYKKLPPKKAAAIMLGTDPEQVDKYHFSNTPQGIDVNLLANLLEVKAFDGDFTDIEKDSYYDFGEEIEYVKSISASELKEWALSNGYQWLGENQINHTSLHQKTSDEANTSQERITKLEQDSLIEIDSINQEDNNKKDRAIEELQAKITELEKQLQAQQSAVNFQEVLPVSNLDENYNPTERETHLLMIDAMAKLLTNQNFNVNKYIRGKNINKKQISEDVTEHITKVLNTPETKPRSLETIRKRLDEALKLNEQAD